MPDSRILILSGGVAHDYATTTPMLSQLLTQEGFVAETTDRLADLARPDLDDFDALILNCVRWSTEWEPGPDGPYRLGQRESDAVLAFLARGNGLMALHAACICFDDWPAYREIIGGFWAWKVSGHGPYQAGWEMTVVDGAHPITQGVTDFAIHDELYHSLTLTRPVHVLMTSCREGRPQPMAWATDYHGARVHFNALGHGPESFQCESFRRMLCQGARWVAGDSGV